WVAVGVRSTAMRRRRLGLPAIRALAASPSLDAALQTLATGPYGHDVRADQSLAEAQRAVVATFVWNVRVLAGWAPRDGVVILRALAAPIEAMNIDEQLRMRPDDAAPAPDPYRLGALATAWPRLAAAADPAAMRRALARSTWGDPGSDDRHEISVVNRLSLAARMAVEVRTAQDWAAGGTALLLARELGFRTAPLLSGQARLLTSRVLGPRAAAAGSLTALQAALPATARWALTDVSTPDGLWRAEAAWWTRVDRDALAMSRHGGPDSRALVGTVAMLAVDAWRVRAALELAARGGRVMEDVDAVA
ncbi:MAG TPA: hypothetical protein VGK35_09305, partial [Actinotalea sp.]